MPIASLDQYIAAPKQRVIWLKTATRATLAGIPYTVFDLACNPGAGTLNIGNTANGVVPNDGVAGYPILNNFSPNIGYISKVEYASTVACWIDVFDRVFAAGAYAYNANITLTAQPSFSSRVPGGTDYKGLQFFVEAVTAFTGTPSVRLQYLDQDGNAGDTGVVSLGAALTIGRNQWVPLAAGDNGIQQLNVVTFSVATVGTANINILRSLWSGRIIAANMGDVHDLLRTGMVQVFDNSALYPLISADSTLSGIPELMIEIANG